MKLSIACLNPYQTLHQISNLKINKNMKISFWAKAVIIALAIALGLCVFAGCSAEIRLAKKINKAKTIAFQNPLSFADFCAKAFPVKDSIGKVVTNYTPANNVDYSKIIDSLLRTIKEVEGRAKLDLSDQGKSNLSVISGLRIEIEALKDGYRKCIPDTIRLSIPIYRRDIASESALNQKIDKLSFDLTKVSQERDALKATSEELTKAKNRLTWYLIGLSVLLIGSIYLNVKNGLKIFLL